MFFASVNHDLQHPQHHGRRTGAAAILGIALIAVLVILLGTIIDLGYVNVAQSELKRTSDAAALAGGWELFDIKVSGESTSLLTSQVSNAADTVSSRNRIATDSPHLSLTNGDVQLGYYDFEAGTFDPFSQISPNAVRVSVHRQQGSNGEVPLFFGAVMGRHTQPMSTSSTAALIHSIDGFYVPGSDNESLELLPFALDIATWEDVLAGNTSDNLRYENGQVVSHENGYHECNLYPQGTGSPGNRGTVDIGPSNNSTNDIARQILHGVSRADLLQMCTPLEFDEAGELPLNGDTGISAGVKDELASIIGQRRIIPIFSRVTGNGNNATFTIVKFAGVRILEVKLTGRMKDKRVIIEPAPIIARNAKINRQAASHSDFVYAPVSLVN